MTVGTYGKTAAALLLTNPIPYEKAPILISNYSYQNITSNFPKKIAVLEINTLPTLLVEPFDLGYAGIGYTFRKKLIDVAKNFDDD